MNGSRFFRVAPLAPFVFASIALLALPGVVGCDSEPPVVPELTQPVSVQPAEPRAGAAETMGAQLQAVRARLDQVEEFLTDAGKRLESTSVEADQLAQMLLQLRDESAALQAAAGEYGRNIEVLGDRMRQAHAEAQAVHAYLTEVRSELAAAQQREARFSGALESLFAELSETRAQISAMEGGTGQTVPLVPHTLPTTQPDSESDPG